MANGIRTGDPRGFNKGRSSKFREGSRVRQTPGEGRSTYRPKHCGNSNKDEDNSPKTLNDKNQQASSQKFRQVPSWSYYWLTTFQSCFSFCFCFFVLKRHGEVTWYEPLYNSKRDGLLWIVILTLMPQTNFSFPKFLFWLIWHYSILLEWD